MASITVEDLGPTHGGKRAVLDGIRKMNDDELWYYLRHLARSSAENHEAILGDGGPTWEGVFVVNHFKSKA